MSETLQRVVVVGTGSFLPNAPVPNDRIDDVLGHLTNAPEKVRDFVRTVGRRMLNNGGVKLRHFALDPETHALTHSIASLGEEAARRALQMAGREPTDIDLLLLSSSSYDTTTPPTSTLLQERLGIETCAEMEVHSNCSGVGKCMQIAYDSLRLGRYRTAMVVYSQLSSVYLRACYFNQAQINKTQATLRYILADGAGAVLLEAQDDPGPERLPGEVLGAYVESIGGKLKPAMTAGGGVRDIMGGTNPAKEVWERGSHHLDQDFFAVNRDAAPFLLVLQLRFRQTAEIARRPRGIPRDRVQLLLCICSFERGQLPFHQERCDATDRYRQSSHDGDGGSHANSERGRHSHDQGRHDPQREQEWARCRRYRREGHCPLLRRQRRLRCLLGHLGHPLHQRGHDRQQRLTDRDAQLEHIIDQIVERVLDTGGDLGQLQESGVDLLDELF